MLHKSLLRLDSLVASSICVALFFFAPQTLSHVFPGEKLSFSHLFMASMMSAVYFMFALTAYYSTAMPGEHSIKTARCALLYHYMYSYVFYRNAAWFAQHKTAVYCYAAVAFHVLMGILYTVAMSKDHKKPADAKSKAN
jgi:hypothetical protein